MATNVKAEAGNDSVAFGAWAHLEMLIYVTPNSKIVGTRGVRDINLANRDLNLPKAKNFANLDRNR